MLIERKASTKKNLWGVKLKAKFRPAVSEIRYKIVALISIGRLCIECWKRDKFSENIGDFGNGIVLKYALKLCLFYMSLGFV